jgi:galactokinase
MTGAGFGGSAIALVRVDRARDFAASVQEAYRRETGRPGTAFPCRPVAGARLLERLD